jgi:hypothetical protein
MDGREAWGSERKSLNSLILVTLFPDTVVQHESESIARTGYPIWGQVTGLLRLLSTEKANEYRADIQLNLKSSRNLKKRVKRPNGVRE